MPKEDFRTDVTAKTKSKSRTFLQILFKASSPGIKLLFRQLKQTFAGHLWEAEIGKLLMQH